MCPHAFECSEDSGGNSDDSELPERKPAVQVAKAPGEVEGGAVGGGVLQPLRGCSLRVEGLSRAKVLRDERGQLLIAQRGPYAVSQGAD
eukprot:2731263-Alexandrium_andersonii.AAC.1